MKGVGSWDLWVREVQIKGLHQAALAAPLKDSGLWGLGAQGFRG